MATVPRRLEADLLAVLVSLLSIIIGYFLGTIPTGYLVARVRGVNIQEVGSGNIGATNVLRALGVLPAVIVMILDPLKGAVATLIPTLLGANAWTVALTGLAVVLGNNFNVLLRLRGGKGIATSIGVFLVIDPMTTLLCVSVGVFTILISRYVSLGSLVGLFSLPLFVLAGGSFLVPHLFLAVCLMLLAIFRHRENIRRLLNGTERRFGERAALKAEPAAAAGGVAGAGGAEAGEAGAGAGGAAAGGAAESGASADEGTAGAAAADDVGDEPGGTA